MKQPAKRTPAIALGTALAFLVQAETTLGHGQDSLPALRVPSGQTRELAEVRATDVNRQERLEEQMHRALSAIERPVSTDEAQIVVYRGGQHLSGFDSLEAALKFCSASGAEAPMAARSSWFVVLLPSGTFVGNFVLPPNTFVVGAAGLPATTISGAPGVAQPAVRLNPGSGAATTSSALVGLQILGQDAAAVRFTGNNANGSLMILDCRIAVETSAVVPAVEVQGGGQDSQNRFTLELEKSWVDSYSGTGIQASVGPHAEIVVSRSGIYGALCGVDVVGTGGADTRLALSRSAIESHGISSSVCAVSGEALDRVEIRRCDIYAANGQGLSVVDVTGGGELKYCMAHAQAGDCMVVDNTQMKVSHCELGAPSGAGFFSARLLNSAVVGFYYTGPVAGPGDVHVDATSVMTTSFCY